MALIQTMTGGALGGLFKACWGRTSRHWVRSSAGMLQCASISTGRSKLFHTQQRHWSCKCYSKSRCDFCLSFRILWLRCLFFLSLLATPCSLLSHLLQQSPSFSFIDSICLYSWFSFLNLFSKQLMLTHCPSCFLCYLPNYMCSVFWDLWHFVCL